MVAAGGERDGVGWPRGVRGSSVLASPYVAGYEREREAAARVYRRLLRVTMGRVSTGRTGSSSWGGSRGSVGR